MSRMNYRFATLLLLNPEHRQRVALLASLLFLALSSGFVRAADPYRGLWVGQATLNYVNEVTVPLDENNVPRAPEPSVPTPTADQATIRLIIHVNGAGQSSLLKQVAILNRAGSPEGDAGTVEQLPDEGNVADNSGATIENESDVALITDERLYGEFPPQPAKRIASAVFDFGDSRATDAINAVIEAVTQSVAQSVFDADAGDFDTSTSRDQLASQAASSAEALGEPIIENADVATAFDQFLRNELPRTVVDDLSTGGDATPVLAAAKQLRDDSFYADSRAVDLVQKLEDIAALTEYDVDGDGVLDDLSLLPSDEVEALRIKLGENTAATYADLEDNYHGFLAGKIFGDMITGAAEAAVAAIASGDPIQEAIRSDSAVTAAQTEAIRIKVARYDDTRARDAVEVVLEAIRQSAEAAALDPLPTDEEILADAEKAGQEALAEKVIRYEVPTDIPTLDYNTFVQSDDFLGSAAIAAQAAAEAAVTERNSNPTLFTLTSLQGAAKAGTAEALRSVLGAAARAVRTELPFRGLGFGLGDPRLQAEIGLEDLDQAGLEATLFLPASHPTNPFRHRRHPDHTVGFDIIRKIRLDFDPASPDALPRAGYGVDRITGVYREEITGLHKPLGPDGDIGLKVEGRFVLNRISLIDQLNSR